MFSPPAVCLKVHHSSASEPTGTDSTGQLVLTVSSEFVFSPQLKLYIPNLQNNMQQCATSLFYIQVVYRKFSLIMQMKQIYIQSE